MHWAYARCALSCHPHDSVCDPACYCRQADGAAKVALFDGVMEHPFAAQVPFFSSEFLLCTAYLEVSSEFSGMPYKVLA